MKHIGIAQARDLPSAGLTQSYAVSTGMASGQLRRENTLPKWLLVVPFQIAGESSAVKRPFPVQAIGCQTLVFLNGTAQLLVFRTHLNLYGS